MNLGVGRCSDGARAGRFFDALHWLRGSVSAAAFAALAAVLIAGAAWSPASAMSPPVTSTTLPPPPAVESPVFELPYAAGSAHRVSQGNAGAFTHQSRGPSEFAWDFLMGEGTMVVAARAGRVVAVEGGMSGGGLSAAYEGRANYVLLAHSDGLFSLYLHLATAGVLVSPGQWVEAGEGIALSGNTGYSSGPHLHFHVQGAELPRTGRSVPVAFAGVGVPGLWALPLSENRYVSAPPAPVAVAVEIGAPEVPDTSGGLGTPGGSGPGLDERRSLFTHQLLPVSVLWDRAVAAGGAVAGGAPPEGAASPARVRLRTLDARGTVQSLTAAPIDGVISGTAGGPAGAAAAAPSVGLEAAATTPERGWIAVWAEFYDGVRWRVCSDISGRPVASAHDVGLASVFLAEPGLKAGAGAEEGVGLTPAGSTEVGLVAGEVLAVEFHLENLGERSVRLLDVGAELAGPPELGLSAIPLEAGSLRDMYLRPGESGVWAGTFSPPAPGFFILRPTARDAAGKELTLPPRRVGQPAAVRVTVLAPGNGTGGGPGEPATTGEPLDPGEQGGPGGPQAPAPVFADLHVGHWAYEAVVRLAERGVVSGYVGPDGRRLFRPDEPVARAQFAKVLVGALGLPVADGGFCPFLDVERSGPNGLYPDDYIAAAFTAGLLSGVSTDPPRFEPYSPVTRRQVSRVAERAGFGDPELPGDQWAPASRGEVAVALAGFLVP